MFCVLQHAAECVTHELTNKLLSYQPLHINDKSLEESKEKAGRKAVEKEKYQSGTSNYQLNNLSLNYLNHTFHHPKYKFPTNGFYTGPVQ